jgi:hypothetical protein
MLFLTLPDQSMQSAQGVRLALGQSRQAIADTKLQARSAARPWHV